MIGVGFGLHKVGLFREGTGPSLRSTLAGALPYRSLLVVRRSYICRMGIVTLAHVKKSTGQKAGAGGLVKVITPVLPQYFSNFKYIHFCLIRVCNDGALLPFLS